jgi:hypothetical protein
MSPPETTKPQVFLSYAVEDRTVARQIADALQQQGVRVFFDETALVAGTDFRKELTQALEKSAAVVAVLSDNSTRSTWVEQELQLALHNVPHVFPVLLDPAGRGTWVWPLVSHLVPLQMRQEPAARQQDLELLAKAVATAVHTPKPTQPTCPAPGQPVAPRGFSVGLGSPRR